MRGYYNPYQNQSPKEIWNRFYYSNKMLVWLMGATLAGMILAGGRFFDILYVVYLTWFGGILFKGFFNDKRLLESYLWGGLSGLTAYVIFFHTALMWQFALLAFFGSAAMAVLVAAATWSPHTEVMLVLLGRVKIQWIVLVLVGLDLLTINPKYPSLRLSDIGGVLYGFLSIYAKRRNLSFDGWFQKRKGGLRYQKTPKKKYRSQTVESDERYNERKRKEQEEVDKILEKIKKSGYESLSAEEKRKLFDRTQS